ncbi:MAG TPA: DNA-processing protein DprA [Mycobacterium sp.]|nr:DNA-processing protein DprA [Mycobacterium sp.]
MDDARRTGEQERVALVALLGEPTAADPRRLYTSWSAIAAEVVRRGSALAVWNEWHPLTLDGPGESDGALVRARDRLEGWRAAGFDLLTVLDRRYPVQLSRVQQIPPVVFVKGEPHAEEVGVSVVGSRAASVRGQEKATAIARGLVERGFAVMSGLATGVDTAAHQATLAAGGRPIGVLGTSITGVYPETNRALHERVGAAGALVPQFLPPTRPAHLGAAQRDDGGALPGVGDRGGRRAQRLARARPLRAGPRAAADCYRRGRRLDPMGSRIVAPAGGLRGRQHRGGAGQCR